MCCIRSIDCWHPCSCIARWPAPAVHVRNDASAAASDVSSSDGGKLRAVMQLPAWKVYMDPFCTDASSTRRYLRERIRVTRREGARA